MRDAPFHEFVDSADRFEFLLLVSGQFHHFAPAASVGYVLDVAGWACESDPRTGDEFLGDLDAAEFHELAHALRSDGVKGLRMNACMVGVRQ